MSWFRFCFCLLSITFLNLPASAEEFNRTKLPVSQPAFKGLKMGCSMVLSGKPTGGTRHLLL
ncbi:hypothetical protein Enr10x_55220 [Gimesia panareensis]|uniref:Uncharacterized protein n=1 Tax=Gimesia panareensis TaxID=2527978 RepID=A0A517QEU8_9PLAN|nr:hypothetical protein [Gimesia panareensis]QDT30162.1 hypothetical protein Enr10x_55220 [Gimesia panareensis]